MLYTKYLNILQTMDCQFHFYGDMLHLFIAFHYKWLQLLLEWEHILKTSDKFDGPTDANLEKWYRNARKFYSIMSKVLPEMYYPYMFSRVFEEPAVLQQWLANPKLRQSLIGICSAQGPEHGNQKTKRDMQHNYYGNDWFLFLLLRMDLQTISALKVRGMLDLWREFTRKRGKEPIPQPNSLNMQGLNARTIEFIMSIEAYQLGQAAPSLLRQVVDDVDPQQSARCKSVADKVNEATNRHPMVDDDDTAEDDSQEVE